MPATIYIILSYILCVCYTKRTLYYTLYTIYYYTVQAKKVDKYKGTIFDIYLNRIKNISFGFGGSGFFTSQSGEKAPWYLNPNLTFPSMITIVLVAFITVLSTGSVKEKGRKDPSLDTAYIQQQQHRTIYNNKDVMNDSYYS